MVVYSPATPLKDEREGLNLVCVRVLTATQALLRHTAGESAPLVIAGELAG